MNKKPNVLLICVDHWPGLLMGAAGHSRILTPTLDQLCQNGVRKELEKLMLQNLYGGDLEWVCDNRLVGRTDKQLEEEPNRSLTGQRGWR